MKGCQRCGYVGQEIYCPKCRVKGNIVPLKTAAQLNKELDGMRGRAEKIKAVIRQLSVGHTA